MNSCRLTFRTAAVLIALVGLSDHAITEPILELKPGEAVVLNPTRPVQAISIGSPNVAFVNPINLSTITITAKTIGTTNVILFDQSGKEISNTIIQVVAHADLVHDRHPPERREIKVFSGVVERRAYLCSQNCSEKPRPRTENAASPTSVNTQGTNRSETIITGDRGTSVEQSTSTSTSGPVE